MQLQAVLCYLSTYIIFITYVLIKIKHKLYVASCELPPPGPVQNFWARTWKEERETYILRDFFRRIKTHSPRYIHTTLRKKAVAFETSVYVAWCVFLDDGRSPFTVIARLTSDPANEDFFAVFWTRLTNVSVDARANIKQQTWTVGPFHEEFQSTLDRFFTFPVVKRQRPATEE